MDWKWNGFEWNKACYCQNRSQLNIRWSRTCLLSSSLSSVAKSIKFCSTVVALEKPTEEFYSSFLPFNIYLIAVFWFLPLNCGIASSTWIWRSCANTKTSWDGHALLEWMQLLWSKRIGLWSRKYMDNDSFITPWNLRHKNCIFSNKKFIGKSWWHLVDGWWHALVFAHNSPPKTTSFTVFWHISNLCMNLAYGVSCP